VVVVLPSKADDKKSHDKIAMAGSRASSVVVYIDGTVGKIEYHG